MSAGADHRTLLGAQSGPDCGLCISPLAVLAAGCLSPPAPALCCQGRAGWSRQSILYKLSADLNAVTHACASLLGLRVAPKLPWHASSSRLWGAGSFDHFLNFQIAFIILLQIGMCVFCAVGSYIWRQQYGYRRYHLAMDAYTQARHAALLNWAPAAQSKVQSYEACSSLHTAQGLQQCSSICNPAHGLRVAAAICMTICSLLRGAEGTVGMNLPRTTAW